MTTCSFSAAVTNRSPILVTLVVAAAPSITTTPPDVPIQEDEVAVHRPGGGGAGEEDTLLQGRKECRIVGKGQGVGHGWTPTPAIIWLNSVDTLEAKSDSVW